jgi:YggT family protein
MDWFLNFVSLLFEVLTIAIFIRVILSWISPRPNALTIILEKITEPILASLRRIIPRTGMFDLTPMVAIIILQLIATFLSRI